MMMPMMWMRTYRTVILDSTVLYIYCRVTGIVYSGIIYGFVKNELVSNSNPVVLRYSHYNDDADDVDENVLYGRMGYLLI